MRPTAPHKDGFLTVSELKTRWGLRTSGSFDRLVKQGALRVVKEKGFRYFDLYDVELIEKTRIRPKSRRSRYHKRLDPQAEAFRMIRDGCTALEIICALDFKAEEVDRMFDEYERVKTRTA